MLLVAKESIEEQMSVFFFYKKKKIQLLILFPCSHLLVIYISLSLKYMWSTAGNNADYPPCQHMKLMSTD